MYSQIAHARARPSHVLVPRPTSSSMTSDRLAEVGALAGHVGAGDYQQAVVDRTHLGVVGDELLFELLGQHWVFSADDVEDVVLGKCRPAVPAVDGQLRQVAE